jgi:hypothetical protein
MSAGLLLWAIIVMCYGLCVTNASSSLVHFTAGATSNVTEGMHQRQCGMPGLLRHPSHRCMHACAVAIEAALLQRCSGAARWIGPRAPNDVQRDCISLLLLLLLLPAVLLPVSRVQP